MPDLPTVQDNSAPDNGCTVRLLSRWIFSTLGTGIDIIDQLEIFYNIDIPVVCRTTRWYIYIKHGRLVL